MGIDLLTPIKELAQKRFEEMEREGYTRDGEGFYICPKCGTRASKNTASGHLPEACECKRAAERAEKDEKERQRKELRRSQSFMYRGMHEHTFANDNGANPEVAELLKKYVDNFEEFKNDGRGILLYGSTGGGKTFFSGCVGNALIDKGYFVKQTNLSRLYSETRQNNDQFTTINNYIARNDLIIIDDLGTERKTEIMKELAFNFIDTLYGECKPFIVSTNLTTSELTNPKDPEDVRTYQRILERCHPVEVENTTGSQRIKKSVEAHEKTRLYLGR